MKKNIIFTLSVVLLLSVNLVISTKSNSLTNSQVNLKTLNIALANMNIDGGFTCFYEENLIYFKNSRVLVCGSTPCCYKNNVGPDNALRKGKCKTAGC